MRKLFQALRFFDFLEAYMKKYTQTHLNATSAP